MNQNQKIVVIEGSAAGPKVASKVRHLDEFAEITIIQKDPDLSIGFCTYSFCTGDLINNRNLIFFTRNSFDLDRSLVCGTIVNNAIAPTETMCIVWNNQRDHAMNCN